MLPPAPFAAGFADAMTLRTLLLGTNLDKTAAADRAASDRTGGRRVGSVVLSFGCILHVETPHVLSKSNSPVVDRERSDRHLANTKLGCTSWSA